MNPQVQQAIDNINAYIVENHNNEITANVLNPILIELANLFDIVGDLSDLNTVDSDSVVSAINWALNQISTGITIHSGQANPNVTPPASFAVGDLYSRLDILENPYQIYIYNGSEWAEIRQAINDSIIGLDTTWSSEKISEAIQGDRFENVPTIDLVGNEITISNASWWIQGVNYNLSPDFEDTINYTSVAGMMRKDIIVAVTGNSMIRIQGSESDTNPLEPTVPPNTLLVTSIDVFHDSIGEPTVPIVGDNYIPKASQGWVNVLLNSAVLTYTPTINDKFSLNITSFTSGHIIPGLNITTQATKIWAGGFFCIRTSGSYPITLKHLGSNGKIRFSFKGEGDFILTEEEGVLFFKLGPIPTTGNAIAYCLNDFVAGEITADQVTYDNTASGLLAETVQEAVDELSGHITQLHETKEDRVSVIPISTNTTISALHHGKILLITADVTITFPTGLGTGFTGCSFRIATGGKMTPAFAGGVTGNDFFADYNPGESLYVFKESNSTNLFYAV